MVRPPFILLVSSAGIWNHKSIYNYNTVYRNDVGSPIQFYSYQPPHVYLSQFGGSTTGNLQSSQSGPLSLIKPSGYHVHNSQKAFLQLYHAFTRKLAEESKQLNMEFKMNFNHQACADQIVQMSKSGIISISNIIDGFLSHCKANLLIELIQSKRVRVRKLESECRNESPNLCIVGDRSVPAQSIMDESQPLLTSKRYGRNAYLVTVAGKLKVILQVLGEKYIIIPKLGGPPDDDIFEFLNLKHENRISADVKNLESAAIDLYASQTDEGSSIYRNFLDVTN
ncbi:BgtAc-31196 [Blumeria graminis f. sp. tritici]|uniref:BgtAc-31196 n=2 Tax=Blumeria graminis f. sp. tritici TaxID=62690 RepID=A0A9X9ML14_BLUGR|nr:hypothetical protein BGT96224_Ac31196 [Blumeria graminis f. sp. tritici 96224]VDB91375.1 BgtAc-31196 [Blumeria graminis f. sp. tritici]